MGNSLMGQCKNFDNLPFCLITANRCGGALGDVSVQASGFTEQPEQLSDRLAVLLGWPEEDDSIIRLQRGSAMPHDFQASVQAGLGVQQCLSNSGTPA